MHREPRNLGYSPFLILLNIVIFCLVFSVPVFAEIVTIQKDYTYQAGEADSKISCRTIAVEQVKRQLLDELGTYLETETEVSGFQLTKDKIIILTAGIVKVDVLEEKWDGFLYSLKAQVTADTDEVFRSIEALRQDRQKIKELEETRKRADELLAEVERLKKDLETAKAEQWEQEQKEYTQAVNELSAIDSFERGYSSSLSGDYADSLMAFTTAVMLYPSFTAAYNNRGAVYAQTGNYNMALKDYNRVISISPDYAPAYYNRGVTYFNLGNYKQAIKDYNRAIRIDPGYARAYSRCGTIHSYTGNHKMAIKDFDKAIKINPVRADDYRNRGDAYYRLGDKKMAVNDYSKTYVIDSKRSGIYRTDKIIIHNKAGQFPSSPANPPAISGHRDLKPSIPNAERFNGPKTVKVIEIDARGRAGHSKTTFPGDTVSTNADTSLHKGIHLSPRVSPPPNVSMSHPRTSNVPHIASYPRISSAPGSSHPQQATPSTPNIHTHTRTLPSSHGRFSPGAANAPPRVIPSPRVSPTPVIASTPRVSASPRISSPPAVSSPPRASSSPGVSASPRIIPSPHAASTRTFSGYSRSSNAGTFGSGRSGGFSGGHIAHRSSHSPRGSWQKR
jgi:tetratricopeptide (TPR) repeat protein